jgi:hypothetical protein
MELLARYNIDIDGTLPLASSLSLSACVDPHLSYLRLDLLTFHVLHFWLHQGKRAVVLGRSNIVGTPVALMLLHKYAALLS